MDVGWVALGVSVVSFVWQVLSWRLNGARLKVSTEQGLRYINFNGWKSGSFKVRVANAGRMPTFVTDVTLSYKRPWWRLKRVPIILSVFGGPSEDSSFTLNPGEVKKFEVPIELLLDLLELDGVKPSKIRPIVMTGKRPFRGKISKDIKSIISDAIQFGPEEFIKPATAATTTDPNR